MGYVTVAVTVGTRYRRRNQRATQPALRFRIGKEDYEARDWSLGGFAAVEPGGADWTAGDAIRITALQLPDGSARPLDIEGRIVRTPPQAADLAVEFLVLSDDAFQLLERMLVRRKS